MVKINLPSAWLPMSIYIWIYVFRQNAPMTALGSSTQQQWTFAKMVQMNVGLQSFPTAKTEPSCALKTYQFQMG